MAEFSRIEVGETTREPDREAVRRIKNASGKANQSGLSAVAGALVSNGWWLFRMNDFLEMAPAMIELAPKLESYNQALRTMPSDINAIDMLREIVVGVPTISGQLRVGSCDDIMRSLESKVKEVWLSMQTEVGTFDKDRLNSVSMLYQDSCSLFPLQTEFQQALEHCAKFQQEAGKQEVLKSLLSKAQDVLKSLKGEIEGAIPSLRSFSEFVDSTSLDLQTISSENRKVLSDIIESCSLFLKQHWDLSGNIPEYVNPALVIMKKMSVVLRETSMQKMVQALEEGVNVVLAWVSLTSLLGSSSVSDEKALEELMVVKRRLLKFNNGLKSYGEIGNQLLQKLVDVRKDVQKTIDAEQASLCQQVLNNLQAKRKALCKVACGTPDGQHWLQCFAGETWEQLIQQAEETIAKIEPNEYTTRQQEAVQAIPLSPSQLHI
eukprot:2930043-Amphidinium_carterae.1